MSERPHAEAGISQQDVARYRANLQGEIDGAALYRARVEAEATPALRELYPRFAKTERRHGRLWRERLEAARARYEHPPRPPKPNQLWHLGKIVFNKAYWHTVPRGRV